MTENRFYAGRHEDGSPAVFDWEDADHPDVMAGSSMWEAKWTAAHLNGEHDLRRHDKCPTCSARGF